MQASSAKALEEEREASKTAVAEAVAAQISAGKESLQEVLVEERQRSEAAIDRAVEQAQKHVTARMEESERANAAGRQRSLAAMDLFLGAARSQLQSLMTAPSASSSEVISVPAETTMSTTELE